MHSPKKQNDPPWSALLRGVVGSVNINISVRLFCQRGEEKRCKYMLVIPESLYSSYLL